MWGGANNPQPVLLQAPQRLREIPHPGHREAFQGPGRCLGHGPRKPRRVAAKEDHPVDSCGFGTPNETPEILGVLDLVEREEKRGLRTMLGHGQEIFHLYVGLRRDPSDDALMVRSPREGRQSLPGSERELGPEDARSLDDLVEARPARALQQGDLVELP